MSNKPNILFILTDDQRFDTIHELGNEQIKTPNMDELVRKGTAFTHAHIPSGSVGAVCMPSRAMINTGRTMYHLTDNGSKIDKDHVLLGEVLKDCGYTTYGIGKWHNSPESFNRSFQDGDRIFFGGMDDHWNVPCNHYDASGKYATSFKRIMNPSLSKRLDVITSDHTLQGQHSTDIFSETAVNFIDTYKSENPFYLYLSYMAPHDPRTMPEEFQNMYNPDDIELPINYREMHEFEYGIYDCRDELLAKYPRSPKEIKQHIADYYGMISHLDFRIGEIIDTLKKTGQYENTLIILAGDNGLALGQHGLMGKQSCYEHSIRVPLVLAGPGIPANKQTDAYVYLLDIFPTLCEMLNVDIPSSVEGKSFYNAIMGDDKGREYIYAGYSDLVRCIKDENYKLVEYKCDRAKHRQLFDMKNDVFEVSNIIEANSEIAKKLEKAMSDFADDWDDKTHPIGSKFWTAR